jgi:hypothetical protein
MTYLLIGTFAKAAEISRGRIKLSYDKNQWTPVPKELKDDQIVLHGENELICVQIFDNVTIAPQKISDWILFIKKPLGHRPRKY